VEKTPHWKLSICKIYFRCYLPVRNVDVCGKWNPGNPSLTKKPLSVILLDTLRTSIERQNLRSLMIRAFTQVYNDCLITVRPAEYKDCLITARPAERDVYLLEVPPQVYIGVTKPEYSLCFHALCWRNERRSPSEYLVTSTVQRFPLTLISRGLFCLTSSGIHFCVVCYFFRVKYQVPHPWEATGKIISLIISHFYVVRHEDKRHWVFHQLLISSW